MKHLVRVALTAVLLLAIWNGVWWAAPLALTFQALAIEAIAFRLNGHDRMFEGLERLGAELRHGFSRKGGAVGQDVH